MDGRQECIRLSSLHFPPAHDGCEDEDSEALRAAQVLKSSSSAHLQEQLRPPARLPRTLAPLKGFLLPQVDQGRQMEKTKDGHRLQGSCPSQESETSERRL